MSKLLGNPCLVRYIEIKHFFKTSLGFLFTSLLNEIYDLEVFFFSSEKKNQLFIE